MQCKDLAEAASGDSCSCLIIVRQNCIAWWVQSHCSIWLHFAWAVILQWIIITSCHVM